MRYQKASPSGGASPSVHVRVVEGSAPSRQLSSPPPGPTGNPLTSPRSTADEVAHAGAFHEMSAAPPLRATRTPLSTSAGTTGAPAHAPLLHASSSVQASPSVQPVPFGATAKFASIVWLKVTAVNVWL